MVILLDVHTCNHKYVHCSNMAARATPLHAAIQISVHIDPVTIAMNRYISVYWYTYIAKQ